MHFAWFFLEHLLLKWLYVTTGGLSNQIAMPLKSPPTNLGVWNTHGRLFNFCHSHLYLHWLTKMPSLVLSCRTPWNHAKLLQVKLHTGGMMHVRVRKKKLKANLWAQWAQLRRSNLHHFVAINVSGHWASYMRDLQTQHGRIRNSQNTSKPLQCK